MRINVIFLALAFSLSCGSTLSKETKLPSNPSSLNSSPKANQPSAEKYKLSKASPFKNAAEEEMFWQIVNMEPDFATIPKTPINAIALYLGLVLSHAPPPKMRAEFLNQLLTKFEAFTTEAEYNIIKKAMMDSANLPKRWMALQIIFKRDAEALAVLDYALHDEARMKEYFQKQRAKMSQEPKLEKPETTAPKVLPGAGPTQRF